MCWFVRASVSTLVRLFSSFSVVSVKSRTSRCPKFILFVNVQVYESYTNARAIPPKSWVQPHENATIHLPNVLGEPCPHSDTMDQEFQTA